MHGRKAAGAEQKRTGAYTNKKKCMTSETLSTVGWIYYFCSFIYEQLDRILQVQNSQCFVTLSCSSKISFGLESQMRSSWYYMIPGKTGSKFFDKTASTLYMLTNKIPSSLHFSQISLFPDDLEQLIQL